MPFSLKALCAAGCFVAASASAATLSGTVTTADGRPIAGALVTVFSEAGDRRETVYSGPDGGYLVRTDFSGALKLRARAPYFRDAVNTVRVAGDEAAAVDFTIEKLTAPAALSDSLVASAHAATLRWRDPDTRAAFVSQCHFCHQIGNALTRVPRDEAAWGVTVRRMEGYLALLTDRQAEDIRKTLARGFTGEPVEAIETYDVSPELYRAKFEEWRAGDGMSFIHDADVGRDGKLYGADEGHDVIWILDRGTGRVEQAPLPDSDLPVGGLFSGFSLPIGIFTGKHGPHSLAQAKDGRFWITCALSSSLMSFDPETRAFKVYRIGHDALYPHTVRIDGQGMVWFTNAASNQVARFDPATEKFTLIDLPSNGFWRWTADAFFPVMLKVASWFPRRDVHLKLSPHKWANVGHDILNMPYGLDVNPIDGSIWYAKLYANRIGRVDPETLAVTEFETPLRGPRRPRFDRNGILWIPSFDDSALMRFDPRSTKFETFTLPRLAPGEYETPYALNVHPKTGDVWITSNLSDRIFRFIPATRSFVSYPSPTRVTFLRDLVFTEDGKVCSSQSNLPAYAIEDGAPSFICLDPEGAAKDRAGKISRQLK